MTPPDSGEMIGVCDLDGFPKSWPEHDYPHRPLPSCVNWEPVAVAQAESKPDSGEREVLCPECGAAKGPWYPYCTKAGDFGVHVMRRVSLPLPLAQRILTALVKRREWELAAELRAIVERKP